MRLFAMETATVFQTATSSHTPTFAPFQAPYLLSFFLFFLTLLPIACSVPHVPQRQCCASHVTS